MALTTVAYRLVNPVPFFASIVSAHPPATSFRLLIEMATPILILPLFAYYPTLHATAYAFFFSALIVTIYTDYTRMLISRFVTLFAIPVVYLASIFNLLPISLLQSIIGSVGGFVILFSIAKVFSLLRGKDGLGQGDIDLIAFIGACTGLIGVWLTLLIGSITGSCWGAAQIIWNKNQTYLSINNIALPFGPFLAFGAICTVYLLPHLSCYIAL